MKRFAGISNVQDLLQAFKQDGAFVWDKPLMRFSHNQRYGSKFPSVEWLPESKAIISRYPIKAHNQTEGIPNEVRLPPDFLQMVQVIFDDLPSIRSRTKYVSALRGADGPWLRFVSAQQHTPDRDDWHPDGHPINVIVPINPFTKDNGATRLRLNAQPPDYYEREVIFESPPFHAVVYDALTHHKQGGNYTNSDRYCLIFNLDPAILMSRNEVLFEWAKQRF